jgi:hypothetical protein
MMTKQNECFAELLKAELMERYGLREDQVQLQLTVCTTDLELGRQILKDFDSEGNETKLLLPEENDCDFVRGEHFRSVYIHRKDGFYGAYINNNDEA